MEKACRLCGTQLFAPSTNVGRHECTAYDKSLCHPCLIKCIAVTRVGQTDCYFRNAKCACGWWTVEGPFNVNIQAARPPFFQS
jgi:hypothetical protein